MKNWLFLAVAVVIAIPGLYLRLCGIQTEPQFEATIFGLAILGAAFLLSWACEVAQLDISQALALALIALVAVLPEYVVDAYFAWTAANNAEYIPYVTANMTGANRLLVGIGWPLVAFIFWSKRRKSVEIDEKQTIELSFLILATLYSFIIPIKGTLSLIDSFFLLTLFVLYIWTSSKGKVEAPELTGPAVSIGRLSKGRRRAATAALFLFAAVVIFLSAEPFAEGLLGMGRAWGIEEFILVQWLAPLASEAPEIVIALVFVLNNNAAAALGTLVSSKVNQWTLLVATLPIVYSISLGAPASLPLDGRQVEEILLTSAQSLFAVAILARLRLPLREAVVLFLLFVTQLAFPNSWVRYGYSGVYIILALALLCKDKQAVRSIYSTLRQSFRSLKTTDRTGSGHLDS